MTRPGVDAGEVGELRGGARGPGRYRAADLQGLLQVVPGAAEVAADLVHVGDVAEICRCLQRGRPEGAVDVQRGEVVLERLVKVTAEPVAVTDVDQVPRRLGRAGVQGAVHVQRPLVVVARLVQVAVFDEHGADQAEVGGGVRRIGPFVDRQGMPEEVERARQVAHREQDRAGVAQARGERAAFRPYLGGQFRGVPVQAQRGGQVAALPGHRTQIVGELDHVRFACVACRAEPERGRVVLLGPVQLAAAEHKAAEHVVHVDEEADEILVRAVAGRHRRLRQRERALIGGDRQALLVPGQRVAACRGVADRERQRPGFVRTRLARPGVACLRTSGRAVRAVGSFGHRLSRWVLVKARSARSSAEQERLRRRSPRTRPR
jgi:hypothetical protein